MDKTWLPYLYWMDTIPEMGRKTNYMLLEKWHSPIDIYNIEETLLAPYLRPKQYANFIRAKKRTGDDIQRAYHHMLKQNIAFIPYMHPLFPEKLKKIPDAPFGIYVAGSLPDIRKPSVAIIGARICSEYGRHMARTFAADFARLDINVISGMAKGIDGIGQRAVLEAGGRTYGVLGCGVDVCYPSENRDIYQLLWERGGLISEYPPGMQPLSKQFPPRNRIISALADAVIVIEAKKKSGTMITVDMALEQGKEVYALPGRCTDLLSEGCNMLIKQGAGVAISAEDIAEDIYRILEIKQSPFAGKSETSDISNMEKLNTLQTQIYQIMELEIRTIDEILERFRNQYPQKQLTVIDMMCELMTLQMMGYVEKTNGGFKRM